MITERKRTGMLQNGNERNGYRTEWLQNGMITKWKRTGMLQNGKERNGCRTEKNGKVYRTENNGKAIKLVPSPSETGFGV